MASAICKRCGLLCGVEYKYKYEGCGDSYVLSQLHYMFAWVHTSEHANFKQIDLMSAANQHHGRD